jgi:hypothetical protein
MTATHDTTNDTIMKADSRGRLRFSPEQRITLLKAYQASGLSVKGRVVIVSFLPNCHRRC